MKEIHKAAFDPFNPEIKENELNEEEQCQEVEQPKQRTPIKRPVEEVSPAHSEGHFAQ